MAIAKADKVIDVIGQVQAQEWARWAHWAFVTGAGQAHRFSKVRELQETLSYTDTRAQPHQMADDCQDSWKKIWTIHQDDLLTRPPDWEAWEQLPVFTGLDVRLTSRKFKLKTALGQVRLHPRAL